MARRGATETAPRPISSAPALGLKSAYRRELHLAFSLPRQVIEVANIFFALRAHHSHHSGRWVSPEAGLQRNG
jgi:hypothetical protein